MPLVTSFSQQFDTYINTKPISADETPRDFSKLSEFLHQHRADAKDLVEADLHKLYMSLDSYIPYIRILIVKNDKKLIDEVKTRVTISPLSLQQWVITVCDLQNCGNSKTNLLDTINPLIYLTKNINTETIPTILAAVFKVIRLASDNQPYQHTMDIEVVAKIIESICTYLDQSLPTNAHLDKNQIAAIGKSLQYLLANQIITKATMILVTTFHRYLKQASKDSQTQFTIQNIADINTGLAHISTILKGKETEKALSDLMSDWQKIQKDISSSESKTSSPARKNSISSAPSAIQHHQAAPSSSGIASSSPNSSQKGHTEADPSSPTLRRKNSFIHSFKQKVKSFTHSEPNSPRSESPTPKDRANLEAAQDKSAGSAGASSAPGNKPVASSSTSSLSSPASLKKGSTEVSPSTPSSTLSRKNSVNVTHASAVQAKSTSTSSGLTFPRPESASKTSSAPGNAPVANSSAATSSSPSSVKDRRALFEAKK